MLRAGRGERPGVSGERSVADADAERDRCGVCEADTGCESRAFGVYGESTMHEASREDGEMMLCGDSSVAGAGVKYVLLFSSSLPARMCSGVCSSIELVRVVVAVGVNPDDGCKLCMGVTAVDANEPALDSVDSGEVHDSVVKSNCDAVPFSELSSLLATTVLPFCAAFIVRGYTLVSFGLNKCWMRCSFSTVTLCCCCITAAFFAFLRCLRNASACSNSCSCCCSFILRRSASVT